MGTPRTGDKSAIQNKYLFKFYNDGFISTNNSEQKEQTNKQKYVFYCSVSQIHINPEKNTKTTSSDVPTVGDRPYIRKPGTATMKKISNPPGQIIICLGGLLICPE